MWKHLKKWLDFGNTVNENEEDLMKKFLIVGLGNIGEKYHNTRHNIGFKILDYLAEKEEATFETVKLGDVTTLKVKGRTLILLKPSTYMNLSGKAIKYWLEKEKIPLNKKKNANVIGSISTIMMVIGGDEDEDDDDGGGDF